MVCTESGRSCQEGPSDLTWIDLSFYRWINRDPGRWRGLSRNTQGVRGCAETEARGYRKHSLSPGKAAALMWKMSHSCPWSVLLPWWRKSSPRLREFLNPHCHSQLCWTRPLRVSQTPSSISIIQAALLWGSIYRPPLWLLPWLPGETATHGSLKCLGSCSEWGQTKMPTSAISCSALPTVVTHSSGLALPVAIFEMVPLKHSCCHTSYTAICILCPLCVSSTQYGLCPELAEAHRVCEGAG